MNSYLLALVALKGLDNRVHSALGEAQQVAVGLGGAKRQALDQNCKREPTSVTLHGDWAYSMPASCIVLCSSCATASRGFRRWRSSCSCCKDVRSFSIARAEKHARAASHLLVKTFFILQKFFPKFRDLVELGGNPSVVAFPPLHVGAAQRAVLSAGAGLALLPVVPVDLFATAGTDGFLLRLRAAALLFFLRLGHSLKRSLKLGSPLGHQGLLLFKRRHRHLSQLQHVGQPQANKNTCLPSGVANI
jgi:hypothetical protein